MIIVIGLTHFIPFFCFQRLTMNVCLFVAAVFIFEVHFLTPLHRVVSKEKCLQICLCNRATWGLYSSYVFST